MNNKLIVKLAITSAFIAMPSVGVLQMGITNASSNLSAEAKAKKAFGWAKKSEKMLAKGKVEKALEFAEAAVEADMLNLEYRSLLSRIYMKQGRFVAAERTLMDVIELGQTDARTVISLALARTAQGKVESAVSLVDANRAILPASDYGLALALAGDNQRAIDVLVEAIRSDNANARTRQNLALAYALVGRWREAQVMASQDMAQTVVTQRLVQWATFARPGAYEVRVAGLLGVEAQQDSGQPVRLALNAVPMADEVQMAAVEAAPVVSAAPTAELAAIGPAPVNFAPAEKSVTVAAAAPPPAPVFTAPLIEAPATPVKTAAKTAAKIALNDVIPAPAVKSAAGSHLVQLGAFTSATNAQKAWSQFKAKHGVLQNFEPVTTTVTVNGKKFIRVAAMGFGSRASADSACSAIRGKGGVCIVRSVSSNAPARMAAKPARKPVRVASR
jgi:Flp pilus assembly protein TadD